MLDLDGVVCIIRLSLYNIFFSSPWIWFCFLSLLQKLSFITGMSLVLAWEIKMNCPILAPPIAMQMENWLYKGVFIYSKRLTFQQSNKTLQSNQDLSIVYSTFSRYGISSVLWEVILKYMPRNASQLICW